MSIKVNLSPENQITTSKLDTLITQLQRFAPHDGQFSINAHNIDVIRASKPSDISAYLVSTPGICIVAQGAKAVSLAHEQYSYDQSNLVVYAAEVPICTHILKASTEQPFLSLVIKLPQQQLQQQVQKVFPEGIKKSAKMNALYIGDRNLKIIQSASRLMDLVVEDDNADLLVPMAIDEILIHLLRGEHGQSIAQIAMADSHFYKVAKVITWLKDNYNQGVKVDELAAIACMSPTSFHNHFKSITAMSPLQFQKALRLQKARQLIVNNLYDVSKASLEVGYTSLSQFSREYSREFGVAPSKDTMMT